MRKVVYSPVFDVDAVESVELVGSVGSVVAVAVIVPWPDGTEFTTT
jgi:hypothetical protein